MKKLLIATIFALSACAATHAQSSPCPQGLVCITPAAAQAALEAGDKAKALEAENKALLQALADQKNVTADVKIELARTVGEKTRLEIEVPRLSALLEVCMKKRKVSVGLINF